MLIRRGLACEGRRLHYTTVSDVITCLCVIVSADSFWCYHANGLYQPEAAETQPCRGIPSTLTSRHFFAHPKSRKELLPWHAAAAGCQSLPRLLDLWPTTVAGSSRDPGRGRGHGTALIDFGSSISFYRFSMHGAAGIRKPTLRCFHSVREAVGRQKPDGPPLARP